MNDHLTPGTGNDRREELPGFFGAEEARPRQEIDPSVWPAIDAFLEEHHGGQERLIPLLHHVQQQMGYLPFEVQEYVADRLGLSPVQVYGVVSFYHLFTTTPRARYQVKVCMGTACFVRQSQRVLDALKDACKVELGGISEDGLFNLDQVRCIGACGLAPAVMINDDVYGNLTAQRARRLVRKLRTEAKFAAEKSAESEEATQ
jgi:NADH:ubiquinone oxidoreductase subunit E